MTSPTVRYSSRYLEIWALIMVLLFLGIAHLLVYHPGEPFFNNDETRHVMTGVYFRDLLHDLPFCHFKDYTISYYLQYPALGLLIWPPLFYGIEGLFMTVFGTSIVAAKALAGLFAGMALTYFFSLARHTHGTRTALLATLLLGFSPLMFSLSRQVMLEVPALAFGLAALYHFWCYQENQQRHHLVLAALASALAALTRFDAIYLVPLFVLLLADRRQLGLLRRREVLIAAALVVLSVTPCYVLTAMEFGWVHARAAVGNGLAQGFEGFLAPANFIYYPAVLPEQLGWPLLGAAILGLSACLNASARQAMSPYLALLAATYITFSPLAEHEARHTIYWLPAFALLAAHGLPGIFPRVANRWLRLLPGLGVLLATIWISMSPSAPYVRGYEAAAQYIVNHSKDSRFCLFDGFFDGNFIYQIRRHDADRRLWILRGDKVFYSSLGYPGMDYAAYAQTPDDILSGIFRYDPEYIVVEEPGVPLPGADLLRSVLKTHAERFHLEQAIPIESNLGRFGEVKLQIFHNTLRNPFPERSLKINIPGLRREIETAVPQ